MHLLFGFSGRIGRGQWWLGQLACLVLCLLGLAMMIPLATAVNVEGKPALENLSAGWITTMVALFALTTWINVACSVKRFHDRNKSGWWFFIVFAPYVGSLWQIVECGCLAGTPGANDYGSPNGTGRTLTLEDFDIERLEGPEKSSRPQIARPAVSVPAVGRRAAAQGFGRRMA